jgi:hypothetical protein
MRMARITCLWLLLLISGASAIAEEYVVAPVRNPEYRPNRLFSPAEDLTSPRFKGLREKYGLDDVVKGETDEFKRILLLRHWLRQHVVVDRRKAAVAENEDALRMLEESPKGGAYHCGHFDKMQNAVLNSMGYVTRIVFAGAGEKERPLSGSHGIDEVWVNSMCKWVVLDAELDSHFEKDGVPLSALEIRREFWRDGAKSVFRHRAPERSKLPKEQDDTWGHTPRTYAWVSWYADARPHTLWPERSGGPHIVLDDDPWRTGTWYRDGKKHWAYAAGAFKPVKDEGLIYWTPNVLHVAATVRGKSVDVAIESDTPNFKEYQISEDGKLWQPTDKEFTLTLSKERHEWRLRSMNIAGVVGPEYRLVVERAGKTRTPAAPTRDLEREEGAKDSSARP